MKSPDLKGHENRMFYICEKFHMYSVIPVLLYCNMAFTL